MKYYIVIKNGDDFYDIWSDFKDIFLNKRSKVQKNIMSPFFHLIKSLAKNKCICSLFSKTKREKTNQILMILITYGEYVARGLKRQKCGDDILISFRHNFHLWTHIAILYSKTDKLKHTDSTAGVGE